ncbi:hypothetical protein O181_056918 [Austropuccinia psidii MF-1]|uniref:CCHC-type domain-containing protein n=1 Tax=Austropuccinia psidii MF-1 TaxID=1389203 RepID=A0A9Q3EAD9_9BASI|nr:hypothetical protein [Austropuccinia psidii MF-1]
MLHINDQLRILKDHVLEKIDNTNQFATHLAKSDSERQNLKNEIIANVEKIHNNCEPQIPRHSTPLNEEKRSINGSLTPFLGENPICAKDIPRLEELPTFSGEGEYNHIDFIRTIDMLQEDFHIADEIIVGKLHSLFTRNAKKLYYKTRLDNEKDKPLTWFLKQKDRLSALHLDMSDSIINMKILRKCVGGLEHAIKCRCVEPCSTEDYIDAMEGIITRTRIGKTWTRVPMESKMVPKTSREDKRPERPILKCHKCGGTSHWANTCTKRTNINEVQVIEAVQCTEEKEESDIDYAVSEDTPVEDYPIEEITAFFQVTEVHTHLPQYSEDCNNLINIQYAIMCKTKPARGKGYTSGASFITSILMNHIEARVNLDTGAFCTCIGKDYLQAIFPGWKNHLLPIEGLQFISSSNNMYSLGKLDTNIVLPHPVGSVRMKAKIVVMDNCTSQHITLANQLVEAQINPSLSPRMRHDLIDVLYTYNNAFASDNEPLGTIKGHEVDITPNIDRPFPPVLRRPAYPANPRAREALEKHIQELIQLGVLRKVGYY